MPVLRARDVIRDTKPIYAHPEETVRDAVEKMAMHNIGSIPVVDEEQRVLGMFTERDLVRLMAERGAQALEAKLGEVMTR